MMRLLVYEVAMTPAQKAELDQLRRKSEERFRGLVKVAAATVAKGRDATQFTAELAVALMEQIPVEVLAGMLASQVVREAVDCR